MDAPRLLWGTTRTNHRGYHGRVHIVRPGPHQVAWCGVPVDAVWPQRPQPRHRDLPAICPECTISYLTTTYPANR